MRTDENTLNESEELTNLLKQRLESEIGIPLTPKTIKQVELDFNNDVILTDYFPIHQITQLKIDDENITGYTLIEDEGTIYLNKNYTGKLYLEYTYGLKEEEYLPIIRLMDAAYLLKEQGYECCGCTMKLYEADELDNSMMKNASSLKESNVTVSYDTGLSRGAIIQSMINNLRNRYNCTVRMI